jgi:DNA-binding NarL/FixJ family response regulator
MRKPSTPKRASSVSDAPSEKKHFHGKRVVIVDDHPLIRRGLERMIHSGDGFVVCGEAGNAADGVEVVRKEKPDVAIVDIGLPGRDGIDLTRQLTREFPRLAVLILSMHEESEYAIQAIQAGARGYMVKHDAVEKIDVALQQVLTGNVYLSPGIRGVVSIDKRSAGSGRRAGASVKARKAPAANGTTSYI